MAVPLLDLQAQHATIRDEVVRAMTAVVDAQTFILGEPVAELERQVAALSQTRHAIGCANGTDAILLALRALDVGHGDEVVTTPFTFFATAGAVHNSGGKPVFVDIDPKTFNIDPQQIGSAITSKTKAVIAVDLFGQMAAIEQVITAAGSVPVIEDSAQSIGASRVIGGKRVMSGEAASICTFSFFPSKNLGGYGDGGMMVCQDDALFDTLMKLRTHGSRKTYYHEIVGYNSRLDTLQAAVLNVKLPHLAQWTERRRAVARRYDVLLGGINDLVIPEVTPGREHVYHLYVIRSGKRDALKKHLADRGISTVLNYPKALPFYPAYAYLGHKPEDFPIAYSHQSSILSLPIYPEMTHEMIDWVATAIADFLGRKG